MKFIVVDEYLGGSSQVEAKDAKEAVIKVLGNGLKKCLSRKLIEVKPSECHVPGAKRFEDEVTWAGWGPGCKFAGKLPKHQVIATVFER